MIQATTGGQRVLIGRLGLGALLLLLTPLLVIACTSTSQAGSTPRTLTVAAASDLQVAFTSIGQLFEEETGAKVVFQFGSSGNLAKQIENGAPVDLFASASEDYVRQLALKGAVVAETEQLYALGRIVLVSYKNHYPQVARLEDLLRPEVKHVSLPNPEHAPYGVAAREALVAAGLWEQVKPKVVYGENARQALQFVQTGNAEAGIVALSIAVVPEVNISPIDDSLYRPLRQSLAVVKGTRQEQLAREFAAFVNGPRGSPIMERYGFTVPEGR